MIASVYTEGAPRSLAFGDRGYRYDASININSNTPYNYDAVPRVCFPPSVPTYIDFYRQRTRYRIRKRLLRGQILRKSMGRFMSPDWSAKVEPVPYSKLDDPQSLNLYAYVMNNPLTRADADGHMGSQAEATAQETEDWVNGSGSSPVGKRPGDAPAQQQTAQQQAAAIPGSVKSAIMNSVNASNAPSGADTTGGFHEEGGIAGTNASGGVVISPAIPGAYSPSGVVSTNLMPVDPSLNASMSTVTVSWHVHPSGRTAAGDLAWNQPPWVRTSE